MPSTVASAPRPLTDPSIDVVVDSRRARRFTMPFAALALAAVVTTVSLSPVGTAAFIDAPLDLRAVLVALFRVDDLRLLPFIVAAILLIGAGAERVMGARRVLLAYIGGGVAISVLGLAIGVVETSFLPALPLNSPPFEGAPPIAALLAVTMASSCFAGALWRRRVRLASVFVALTLFLYSASASDLYALVALPVGLAMGMLAGGQRARLRVQRSSHHETRVLLSALTAVTAIGPVIATVWGSGAGLLSVYGWLSVDPLTSADGIVCVGSSALPCPSAENYAELQPLAGWIAILPLAILLVASWGILRGRRGALGLAIAMNLLVFAGVAYLFAVTEPSTLADLAAVRPTDAISVWQTLVGLAVSALVPLVVALTLFVFRRAAPVPSVPGARSSFALTVGIAASGTLAFTLAGTLGFADQFSPRPDAAFLVQTLPLRLLPPTLLPVESVQFVPLTPWAQAIWYLPSAVFWAVCLVAALRLVVRSSEAQATGDRVRARAVLERGGGGTLAWMTTWPGNAYWFAPDADAAFAYRVSGGVAVTLGGAFGADRARPGIGRAFVDFCGEHGWTPVFYSVDDETRDALADLGWQHTSVADEALLDPRTWTPTGKKRQDVRTATNRAAREGVTTQWTRWMDLTFLDRAQLREISEGWVADKTIPEMGFTLGGLDETADPAVRLMLARDREGRIVAVTSWLPVRGSDGVVGYALDVMRRRDDAMNGVMEFVIGAVVEQARAEGCSVLSLSGSPLASHREGDAADLPAVDRVLEQLSALLEPAYGFRSLANFKKKFQPEFAPMWMIYPDATHLPAIGLALLRCYVPGLTLAGAARLGARLRPAARESAEVSA
ncbi:phosphatidylglycerol lysyltransferase domain-containing protein [Microbacterium testaceum]|uniref:bifunctional lysylphosphatidylglycerol flippase/synthetase MprF n=1 Tax=Microbacterium testaceum TaxID=2033 RepID=UPI003431EDAD